MIRAVYTPHVAVPPELRTYNNDGTLIERPEDAKNEIERLVYTFVKNISPFHRSLIICTCKELDFLTYSGKSRKPIVGGTTHRLHLG